MLSESDVLNLIENAENIRDETIIASNSRFEQKHMQSTVKNFNSS